MTSPYLTAPEDLPSLLDGEPPYRTDQLRDWLYRTPVLTVDEMTNLPGAIRDQIGDDLWPF
jgi:adenine C2-methylase RlmN of 23S rRNA A2503 and tRNA A37